MNKLIFALICFCLISPAFGQLTIQVVGVPVNTPADEPLFIAGNFNNWAAGNQEYILTKKNGNYMITINPPVGEVEFKFTRGSWETVEGSENGNFQANHTCDYKGGFQTVSVNILGWEDLSKKDENSTASDNVLLMDQDFYIPQLDRHRKVWIYLPPDYESSGKNYPVLYMQDAQNLFDASSSFSGEWEVDETLNDLFEAGDYGCIVVGIENGGEYRLDEYTPWSNQEDGGGQGKIYADFLANTLKPYIDSHFHTLQGRDFTGVAGSSLGGLMAMYTAVRYQDIFGKAGVLSPAFWFSDSCFQQVYTTDKKDNLRVYFVSGETESKGMVPDMIHMYNSLVEKGYDNEDLYFITKADGQHSEWFWAREFPDVYHWLFGDLIITVPRDNQPDVYIYPGGDRKSVHVTIDQPGYSLAFYTLNGKKLLESKIGKDGNVNIDALKNGVYYLSLKDPRQNILHVDKYIKR